MKENTEVISEIIFAHFPTGRTIGNQTSLFFNILRKHSFFFKSQLLKGVATLGIGIVLLVAVFLFFTQLAEYGWSEMRARLNSLAGQIILL